MTRAVQLIPLLAVCGLLSTACGGDDRITATFTSDIVQRDVCRIKAGETRESCVREDATFRLRVTVVEDAEDRVWLSGIRLQGEQDRRVLGTRDSEGGFLFYDESSSVNRVTGCTFTNSLLLSLKVDEEADATQVGVDECISLVGREERRDTTSVECDDINDPPQEVTRITRRRWENAAGCGDPE